MNRPKGTFTTEFDGNETEQFITRRDKREVGTTEQVRRKRSELGLRVDTIGVHLHQPSQFFRSETTVEIDDRTNANELNRRRLLQARNQVVSKQL